MKKSSCISQAEVPFSGGQKYQVSLEGALHHSMVVEQLHQDEFAGEIERLSDLDRQQLLEQAQMWTALQCRRVLS